MAFGGRLDLPAGALPPSYGLPQTLFDLRPEAKPSPLGFIRGGNKTALDLQAETLPGGRSYSGDFSGVGSGGEWWSSSLFDGLTSTFSLYNNSKRASAGGGGADPRVLLSVRCLKN